MTLRKAHILFAVSLAALAGPSLGQEDLSALAEKAKDSVVLLRVYGATNNLLGTGTGFYVAPRQIVTNHHVIDDAHRVVALHADKSEVEIDGALAIDEFNDLAVLRTSKPNPTELQLSDTGTVVVGQSIVVLGNPEGLAGTLSNGLVSALRPEGLEEDYPEGERRPPVFQISAPISPGSSGSPIMNLSGEVVGVAVSGYIYGQNLNFAVPWEPLHQIIQASSAGKLTFTYGSAVSASKVEYLRNVGISLALFIAICWWLRDKKPRTKLKGL